MNFFELQFFDKKFRNRLRISSGRHQLAELDVRSGLTINYFPNYYYYINLYQLTNP